VDLEPLSAGAWWSHGIVLLAAGDLAGARDAGRRAQEIAPGHGGGTIVLDADLLDGRPRQVLDGIRGEDERRRLYYTALAEHSLGNVVEARRALEEFTARFGTDHPMDAAKALAWCGRPDDAFTWLERAIQFRGRGSDPFSESLSPMLRSLHADPRWAQFRRKLNLPTD
jgi:hypothetical protein